MQSRSAGADQTQAAARRDRDARPSGTRLWVLGVIGRGRGRAVTFVRTGVACVLRGRVHFRWCSCKAKA